MQTFLVQPYSNTYVGRHDNIHGSDRLVFDFTNEYTKMVAFREPNAAYFSVPHKHIKSMTLDGVNRVFNMGEYIYMPDHQELRFSLEYDIYSKLPDESSNDHKERKELLRELGIRKTH